MRFGTTTVSGSGSRSSQRPAEDFYLWRVPGKAISIQIQLQVIDRLGAEVMNGFWSVPKRGAEVGGVLLGKKIAAGTTILVEDYEVVPCEHSGGPSYVLSAHDRKKLEETVARWRYYPDKHVVGYFRSHTREGLMLGGEDRDLIGRFFSDQASVFLLIKPSASKPATAGFFFWEEGEIHGGSSDQEFPFSGEALIDAGLAHVGGPPPTEITAAAAAREPEAAGEQVGPHSWALLGGRAGLGMRVWFWVVLAALITLGVLQYRTFRMVRPAGRNAPEHAAVPALRVETSGRYLEVRWNRNAPAVRRAGYGVLSISDGAYRRQLQLDRDQLRNGSVAYSPVTNEVNFRLDLVGPKATRSETLRVITAPPARAARDTGIQAPKPAPARPARRPAGGGASHVETAKARPRSKQGFVDDGL